MRPALHLPKALPPGSGDSNGLTDAGGAQEVRLPQRAGARERPIPAAPPITNLKPKGLGFLLATPSATGLMRHLASIHYPKRCVLFFNTLADHFTLKLSEGG